MSDQERLILRVLGPLPMRPCDLQINATRGLHRVGERVTLRVECEVVGVSKYVIPDPPEEGPPQPLFTETG